MKLAELLHRSEDCGVQLAVGTVARRSPLSVQLGGMLFSGRELVVNAQLLDGEQVQATLLSGLVPMAGTLTVTQTALEAGDRVVAISADGWNTVCVLCRVVSG